MNKKDKIKLAVFSIDLNGTVPGALESGLATGLLGAGAGAGLQGLASLLRGDELSKARRRMLYAALIGGGLGGSFGAGLGVGRKEGIEAVNKVFLDTLNSYAQDPAGSMQGLIGH